MAIFPWRFQAEVAKDETDPDVTLFVGPERHVLDDNGDPTGVLFVEQSTSDPMTVKLSELPAILAGGPVKRPAKETPGKLLAAAAAPGKPAATAPITPTPAEVATAPAAVPGAQSKKLSPRSTPRP